MALLVWVSIDKLWPCSFFHLDSLTEQNQPNPTNPFFFSLFPF
jgi:hypothetical protein